jgi:hypothetical protein
MEPELRQLASLVTALRYLGEADDAIEPIAISSLAVSGKRAGRYRTVLADRNHGSSQPVKNAPDQNVRWTWRS